jgi:ABC-type spermidine/putrescine transport system permease subunit II
MIGLLICLGISAVSQRGKEIKNTLIFAPITMIAITLASATALTYLERPVSVDTVHDVQYTGDQN